MAGRTGVGINVGARNGEVVGAAVVGGPMLGNGLRVVGMSVGAGLSAETGARVGVVLGIGFCVGVSITDWIRDGT